MAVSIIFDIILCVLMLVPLNSDTKSFKFLVIQPNDVTSTYIFLNDVKGTLCTILFQLSVPINFVLSAVIRVGFEAACKFYYNDTISWS